MRSSLDAPELKAYIGSLYLERGMQPREIQEKLRIEKGIAVSGQTLRQWLCRAKFTKKKKAVNAALEITLNPVTLAKERSEKTRETLDRWAGDAECIVDKAMAAANDSTGLRDLALSTSTALSGVRLFQLCAGIVPPAPGQSTTFNINFANSPESPFSKEGRARAAAKNVTPKPAAA